MDTLTSTSTPSHPPPLFKKRTVKNTTIRKRPATPPPAVSDSSSDYSSDEGGRKVKRQRKNGVVTAISSNIASKHPATDIETTKFAADRSGRIEPTNDATRQSNWYDDDAQSSKEAKPLLGTTRARPAAATDTTAPEEAAAAGTYRGSANYATFIAKNPNAPTRPVGPLKAPTNIRTITVTDFAPDVCKDYKQTGWCGFGDSCKFLHAREDYKQGWELDRDWEIGTKGKKPRPGASAAGPNGSKTNNPDGDEDDDDALLAGIPFACILCKSPYRNPIVTRCGHYFCESCALRRYRKNPSCAACGAGTGGVFNTAKGLRKLLDKKRERARQRREKAIADGLEVSSEEEDEGQEGEGEEKGEAG